MSRTKFEVGSFKYESLTNRMERLRLSQNHTSSNNNLRSASVDHKTDNKALSRNASSTLLLTPNLNQNSVLTYMKEENGLDLSNKYSGRVAKNTGIRKYNQRMLREVGNVNRKTPPKYTGNSQSTLLTQTTKSPLKNVANENYTSPFRTKSPNKVSVNQFVSRVDNVREQLTVDRNRLSRNVGPVVTAKYSNQRIRLEPGRIYAREELERYFGM